MEVNAIEKGVREGLREKVRFEQRPEKWVRELPSTCLGDEFPRQRIQLEQRLSM